ncbi:hypothetical protein R5M92_11490 [Halomonas sp. Bachu 37]|uniref:hypothetical protein n=1 Tax=Halomonas kashgarensis TaxID=3084920 RepID=UPI00321676E2
MMLYARLQETLKHSARAKAGLLLLTTLLAGALLSGCGADDPPPGEPQTEEPHGHGPMSEDEAAQDMHGEEDL